MKKILEKLGIAVLSVMAEPIGSYLWHLYRLLRDLNNDIYGDLPFFCRIIHILDLGAGMYTLRFGVSIRIYVL
jgi:hypothetical protein